MGGDLVSKWKTRTRNLLEMPRTIRCDFIIKRNELNKGKELI